MIIKATKEHVYKAMLASEVEILRVDTLVDFLLYLNDKGLINNHDFDYEKEAKKFNKKLTNGC